MLIGRVCGWKRVLFLDDDIRRINVAKLSSAASLLDEYPVVGLQVVKYPDASVVGHARRLTGRRQEPFISGGSLLVNPQLLQGFFPPVYHEDWLCIINHLQVGEVAIGGAVGQRPYKPFTTTQRAQFEEFGEILAAGLLWLAYKRSQSSTAPSAAEPSRAPDQSEYWHEATEPGFWQEILKQRTALLDQIALRLEPICQEDMSPMQSVNAARERCARLLPGEFVSFMKKWTDSLCVWQDRVPNLPKVDSVAKAVAELGLWHVVRMHEGDRQWMREAWDYGTNSARLLQVIRRGLVFLPGSGN